MKKILGLDLGTNSIGWAVVNAKEEIRDNETICMNPIGISSAGSRIIPMTADVLGKFENGNTISQTAARTDKRGTRHLLERYLLRRERLLRVLKKMRFLPIHYAEKVNEHGKFIDFSEPKLAWNKGVDGNFEFTFKNSFNEMLADFARHQPQIVADGKKIPYDWTIYYLRKKALSQPVTKEELAWILLQFNQKRGYYQLRGEETEENPDKSVEFLAQKVVRVEATNDKKGDDIWYNVYLENGMIYRRSSRIPLDWEGKVKEFIVTTDLEKDGTPKKDKDGNIKRSFRAPKEDDWTLLKKKTEFDIDNSHKTIGCYIYDALLSNPNQKIIGKLVRTVERKFYKDELSKILETQKHFIPELQDEALYKACIEELYPNNEAHRNNIVKPDFANLFINDILFYQRPLKSKKSLISNCPYEVHKDKEGKEYPVKCIAKSNPLFQEFRLWQFVKNLRIYERDTDTDVTEQYLSSEDKVVELFDWLNNHSEIEQNTLLNSYFKIKKEKGKDNYPYRWNYVEDKKYPCNETRATILKGLEKCGINADFLTKDKELQLWHLLYSVQDKIEICKALKTFAEKNNLPDFFVEVFAKLKPFANDYGSYSEKAIKKLLPLMRMGKYWSFNAIDANTKDRISKMITGEYDEDIKNRVYEKTINLRDESCFRGLPLWLACYIVYDRHSEAKEIMKWETPDDIDKYLKEFKQHSLRNPIVEQVVTETLRTVRDIWKQEGSIDEIHIELGREMKNPADKRKKMTERIQENENTNLRIKTMLMEFMNPEMGIENVRPYSPSQQDILRIYEENALEYLTKDDKDFEFISKISKTAQPSKSDIIRYKCWLEQKYRSPYTNEMIPLAKLFTPAYEIEHIIPQSRYFDDSFSNKVICEAEVNKLKDRQLGYEFIKQHHGEKVPIGQGRSVTILSVEAYEMFVKDNYANNRTKMKKLLMDDIPDGFIERQLNDSRYISKLVKSLLSNIVREKEDNGEWEQEAVSKNLIPCNGAITDRLKKDWGMNDVWNSIVLPRFQRLNELTGKDCFTTISTEGHLIPSMPLELQRGFNKKRIDHRHHAMDAIVIACTTRDHVNLLNNEAAHKKYDKSYRYDLQKNLRRRDEQGHFQEFLKPWATFTTDAKQALENIIVSFKQNLRVINKTVNYFESYKDENGNLRIGKYGIPEKKTTKQIKGDSWAIRKSMHKETGWGKVNLRFKKFVSLNEALKNPQRIVNKDFKQKVLEMLAADKTVKDIKKYVEDNKDIWSDIDIKKIEIYYFTQETNVRYFATRFRSDFVGYFNGVKKLEDALKKIESITDTGIQKILKEHLKTNDNNPELAFSADGIDKMNCNIVAMNGGKPHKPIYKVRRYESGNKYPIGQTGCKAKKFVEADDGTNLFFAIFSTEKLNKDTGEIEKVRSYLTIPLNVMIDCQKKFGSQWKNNIEAYLKEKELVNGDVHLLFILSPNDLVYVPKSGEKINTGSIDRKRIYKFVDGSGVAANFVPESIAQAIFAMTKEDQQKQFKEYRYDIQNEIGVGSRPSKSPNDITGEIMIKEICIPLKVDRLGNIVELNGKKYEE